MVTTPTQDTHQLAFLVSLTILATLGKDASRLDFKALRVVLFTCFHSLGRESLKKLYNVTKCIMKDGFLHLSI